MNLIVDWAIGITVGLLICLPLYLGFACFVGRVLKHGTLPPHRSAEPIADATQRPGSSS